MDTILEAHNLGKTFDEDTVLCDVSIALESGRSIAFVSPSGSGKSTLLSMLGLLLKPTEGTVSIKGIDAFALDDRRRSALRCKELGFIFQHTQLVGSLRAFENVMVSFSFLHEPARRFELSERAKSLVEGFGLADRMDYYPFQLSIGQKRRIAVARALLLDPPILIADEPTNDLDAASAACVTDALFSSVERGSGLLFATHDESLAARADVVMELEGKTFRLRE